MTQEVKQLFVQAHMSLREVMERIDKAGLGIALLVDQKQRFVRTITDGDLRRAILEGESLESSVDALPSPSNGTSITAPADASQDEQLDIMLQSRVRHLPLLHEDGTVAELASSEEFVPHSPMQAVIMAGGFGTRLRPLTDDTPKPMLPIGGKPLMERTIEGLERAGIKRINVTTHYLPEKITDHFGTGSRFGVQLNYVSEDQPLGTAGAIGLMDEVDEPLLVMNGDILTNVDYRSMLKYHQEQEAALTVAVRQYDFKVPYGVIEAKKGRVKRLKEKPQYNFLVNAGIYLLEPSVRRFIPFRKRFDMTELIDTLLENNETVVGFPIMEYWLDIGKHDDFQKAQQDIAERRWAA